MLIIPFVENAFKHGVAKSMEKSWIKIELSEIDNNLEILILNSKKDTQNESKTGGIGLTNVEKRLDLLFGDSYPIEKNETNNRFEIKLTLPLNT